MTSEQKQQLWREIAAWCEQLDPRNPVDPGIKETVIALNVLDIPTLMSCEGHLHGSATPWVEVAVPDYYQVRNKIRHAQKLLSEQQQQVDIEEIRRTKEFVDQYERTLKEQHLPVRQKLYNYLAAFYEKRIAPFEQRLILTGREGMTTMGIQGGAIMEMLSLEERQERLSVYQEEMRAFTAFLKDKYFSVSENPGGTPGLPTNSKEQARCQRLPSYIALMGVDTDTQETVLALHALGIYTIGESGGYPDKKPMYPYVKVAVSEYAEKARQVEQANERVKNARDLLNKSRAADKRESARPGSQGISREEVLRLAEEARERRRILLAEHLPLLKPLLGYLNTFYQDRIVSFDRQLLLTRNGLGRVILKSQGNILQDCRTPEERHEKLQEYQEEMQAFTEFLKDAHSSKTNRT